MPDAADSPNPPVLPNLQAILNKWQALLGLGNWTLSIRWLRPDESTDNEYAEIKSSFNNRTAVIRVAPAARLRGPDVGMEEELFAYNLEEIVVHELLHAVINEHQLQIPEDTLVERTNQERFIRTLSLALTTLTRKSCTPNTATK